MFSHDSNFLLSFTETQDIRAKYWYILFSKTKLQDRTTKQPTYEEVFGFHRVLNPRKNKTLIFINKFPRMQKCIGYVGRTTSNRIFDFCSSFFFLTFNAFWLKSCVQNMYTKCLNIFRNSLLIWLCWCNFLSM